MGDIEKRIEKWRSSKQPVSKKDLEPVLNYYFPGWKSGKGTSHLYKLYHEKLINNTDYFYGHFTIPVTGGNKVKYIYIKQLIKAIEIIETKF